MDGWALRPVACRYQTLADTQVCPGNGRGELALKSPEVLQRKARLPA